MTSWVARVDWETPDTLDEDALDLIMDHLQGNSGVVSGRPDAGTWEATVSIEAPTLDVAVKGALDLVAGATAETPTGVEVLREDVFDGRAQG